METAHAKAQKTKKQREEGKEGRKEKYHKFKIIFLQSDLSEIGSYFHCHFPNCL